MPMYMLEIEAYGIFVTNMPSLEIWEDGALDSTHPISSNGSTISVIINYGGPLPTSLAFTFNDAFAPAGRSIEIRSVKINNQYVNTGNYLSSNNLTKGQSATVDIASVDTNDSDFIFDSSDPVGSEFTTGATETFTAGNDTYRRYNDSDDEVFDMLGGRDTAYLGSGNDKVNGGAGNDLIRGGAGTDLLFGDSGNDRIYGGDDNDTIYGGTGNDRLYGEGGNDEIHGGDGDDRLNGYAGDDVLTGGIGADKLNGGDGIDFLFGGDDNDQLSGGAGDDTIDGGDGNDLAYGGAGDDHIDGGDGEDKLIGNLGADIINGGADNDIIYIMANDWVVGEEIYGGTDTDELVLTHASIIDFTIGTINQLETLTGLNGDQDVTIDINQLGQFSTVDLGGHIAGDIIRTQIDGVYDAVTEGVPIVSNVENGFLIGSTNADTLTVGETELSNLVYGAGTISLGGNTDIINLTETSLTLNTLGTSNASIVGLEEVDASTAAAATTINLNGQTENLIVTGSAHADTLTTGSGDDIINGGDGLDTINSGDGNDVIATTTNLLEQVSVLGTGDHVFTLNGSTYNLHVDFDGTDHWLLIGRGREGWEFDADGQGAFGDVINNLGTTAAFGPAAYSNDFVNEIIDTTATGNLSDVEVRLKRAANITGTEYQEVRWNNSSLTDWTWDLDVTSNLIEVEVQDSVLGVGFTDTTSNTRDALSTPGTDSGNNHQRIFTWGWGGHAGQQGFSYGSAVGGVNGNDPNTFLWENGTENHAIPYTEVYIKLDSISSIAGTLGNDIINAGDGDDLIIEDLGNDTINGGNGNDSIGAGAGADIINGDAGNDNINGGAGGDTLNGGIGNDIIYGGAGDDIIYGDGTTTPTISSMQGWSFQYYDLPFTATPDLNGAGFTLNGGRDHNLASTTAGIASDFTPTIYDGTLDYALKFETTLTITTAGTYTFRTNSDDGSMLYLDGVQIVNNDGLHGNITVTSAGQSLTAGTYTLELVFFERAGGEVLGADISGPDTGGGFVNLATFAGANVVTLSGAGTDGDDMITGGAGTDTLYGGGGADTFIFEAANAFAQADTIMDFSTTDNDKLDISDIITGTFSGDIKDYLQLTSDGSTGDTLIQVDANGTTGGTSFLTIGRLDGIVGLDEVTLFNAGNLII